MKSLFFIMIVVLASGCAPKKTENSESTAATAAKQPTTTVGYRLGKMSQGKGLAPERSTEIISTETLVRDEAMHALRATAPLVVPASVPETLVFRLSLPALGVQPNAFKGEIKNGDRVVREIPAAAFALKQGTSLDVEFTIVEIKTLLSADAQTEFNVVVQALDTKGRPFDAISFGVTTPPSKSVARVIMPLTRYEQEKRISIPDNFKRLATSNGPPLSLIGIIEISNSEGTAVVAQLPQKLAHRLVRLETTSTVTSNDCAHSVSKSMLESPLYSDITISPLDVAIADQNPVVSVKVAVGDVVAVGLYAPDSGLYVAPAAQMTDHAVTARCVAQCQGGGEGDWADSGKWGDDCTACGHTDGNYGSSCYSCMRSHRNWCRWENWREWKDYTTAQSGTEYSLRISPATDTERELNQYLIKFPNQTVAGRSRVLLSGPDIILR